MQISDANETAKAQLRDKSPIHASDGLDLCCLLIGRSLQAPGSQSPCGICGALCAFDFAPQKSRQSMRTAIGRATKFAAILLTILSLTIPAAPVSAEGWHDGGWYRGGWGRHGRWGWYGGWYGGPRFVPIFGVPYLPPPLPRRIVFVSPPPPPPRVIYVPQPSPPAPVVVVPKPRPRRHVQRHVVHCRCG